MEKCQKPGNHVPVDLVSRPIIARKEIIFAIEITVAMHGNVD